MVTFRNLFSFSQKQIDALFAHSKRAHQIRGLKLLSAPLTSLPKDLFPGPHGKLLIITSQKTGRAHQRNKVRRRIKNIYFEEKLYEKPVVNALLTYPEALNLSYEKLKAFLIKGIA